MGRRTGIVAWCAAALVATLGRLPAAPLTELPCAHVRSAGEALAADEPTEADRRRWRAAREELLAAVDSSGWRSFAESAEATCAEEAIRLHAEAILGERPSEALEELEWHATAFPTSDYAPAVRTYLLPIALLSARRPRAATAEMRRLMGEARPDERPLIGLRLVDAVAMTGRTRAARRLANDVLKDSEGAAEESLRPWIATQLAPWRTVVGCRSQALSEPGMSGARGRLTLLNFVAPWCGACEPATKDLESAWKRLPSGTATLLHLVSARDVSPDDGTDLPTHATYRARLGVEAPLVVVPHEVFAAHSATSLPLQLLLDENGVVRHAWSGSGGADVLAAATRALANELSSPTSAARGSGRAGPGSRAGRASGR